MRDASSLASDSVTGGLSSMGTEWTLLQEKWFGGETLDPVFAGIVREWSEFDHTLREIYETADGFLKGVDGLCDSMNLLSDKIVKSFGRHVDPMIAADSLKMREATNVIARRDAPTSCVSKLRTDMEFNLLGPLRSHLHNHNVLRNLLDQRKRKQVELQKMQAQCGSTLNKQSHEGKSHYQIKAEEAYNMAKTAFQEADRFAFSWLYILQEYRGDILDSSLQTLKYLQYELFATSAHTVSGVLPKTMEFRPLIEMSADKLQEEVNLEMEEAENEKDADDEVSHTDTCVRLIHKMAQDSDKKEEAPKAPVDPLSLCSLLSHGFEEGKARQALRMHDNNTQAALDFLVNGGSPSVSPRGEVRAPKTLKRAKRIATRKAELQETSQRKRKESFDARQRSRSQTPAQTPNPSPKASPKASSAKAVEPGLSQASEQLRQDASESAGQAKATSPRPSPIDLLDLDATAPPTDFTSYVEVTPLPSPAGDSLVDLSSLDCAPLSTSPKPSSAAASQTADEQQLAAAAQLAAQLGLTPDQLILAAQQAQQQQQQQQQAPHQLTGEPLQPAVAAGYPSQPGIAPSHGQLPVSGGASAPSSTKRADPFADLI